MITTGEKLKLTPADPSARRVLIYEKQDDRNAKILARVVSGKQVHYLRSSASGLSHEVRFQDRQANQIQGWVMAEDATAAPMLPPPPLTDEAFLQQLASHARTAGSNGFWLLTVAIAETDLQDETDDASGKVGPFNFTPESWEQARALVPGTRPSPETISFWDVQTIVAAHLQVHNSEILSATLSSAPTVWQLYLAHLAGADAARILLTAADTSQTVDATLQQAGLDDQRRERVLIQLAEIGGTSDNSITLNTAFETLRERLTKAITKAHKVLGTTEQMDNLGSLSRKYESGDNPAAIGFDTTGGWSYGPYQLASKAGSVGEFLAFLGGDPAYKAHAEALQDAGGEDAAIAGDDTFKLAWERLAKAPNFVAANHAFIKGKFYDKLSQRLQNAGVLTLTGRAKAVHDVIWSIAVQHGVGGGARLIAKALEPKGDQKWNEDRNVINAIYTERKRVDVHFKNSKPQIRASVLKRFNSEHAEALAMLERQQQPIISVPLGSAIREKAAAVARSEMLTFARTSTGIKIKEGQEPLHDRAVEYFRLAGSKTAKPTTTPWSAAFISFVMSKAGATASQFPFHIGHWFYILEAASNARAGNTNASIVYFDRKDVVPRIGDLVGFSRDSEITNSDHIFARLGRAKGKRHFPSHTDIVVSVQPGKLIAIGGNVSDSISETQVKTITSGTDAGKIALHAKHFFVLRINV